MPYQQKIYLHLPANEDGYRRAEQEARLLGGQLATRSFDWAMWLKPEQLPENKPASKWIEEFKDSYLKTHSLKPSTWLNQWEKIYKRLPADEPLTAALLLSLVDATKKDTRDRLQTCEKLQHLARFAGLDIDLLQFKGNYGPSKVKARDIPDDELIARCWSQIPNPAWQWLYGMLATFGLRDHEVFFCQWRGSELQVLKGKTGPRLVQSPLYPEWVEQWNLHDVRLPKVQNADEVYESGRLGEKVARQFRRYKIPFGPYDLRHAYGIRTAAFGIPPSIAAAQMGHTPQIHQARYHHHINAAHIRETVERAMNRDDRPIVPDV
jgi:integrase